MAQFNLFDLLYENYEFDKNKPVRLIETFAGIGTQRMGFERQGIEVDVVAIVEIDKDAVKSYAAMHTDYLEVRDTYFDDHDITVEHMVETLQNKMVGYDFKHSKHTIHLKTNIERIRDYYLSDLLSKNLGDISKVKGKDLPKDIDMLTYSFPCTDLSKAGLQKGLSDTRSGLVYQVFRIVEELKSLGNMPKTLVMENVVDLVQRKFINEFHEMQNEVESFGYTNYTFRMNAKDYGVAQNRDRVFMVSIPKEHNYNEPKSFELDKKLIDYLEDDVDEKYFLSDKMRSFFEQNSINNKEKGNGFRFKPKDIDQSEVASTITTLAGNRMDDNFVKIPEDTVKGYKEAYNGDGVYINRPHQKRGVVQTNKIQTLKTGCNDVGVVVHKENLRIRKLTPLECFRLMGIDDQYYHKAKQVNSNSQLYKQAGNAIVVDVFGLIVKQLTYKRRTICN